MELMRYFWDTAVARDPSAGPLDEGVRFPICGPEPLERLWRDAGLTSVSSRAIDVPTVFRDLDDYWTRGSWVTGQHQAPAAPKPGSHEGRGPVGDLNPRPCAQVKASEWR